MYWADRSYLIKAISSLSDLPMVLTVLVSQGDCRRKCLRERTSQKSKMNLVPSDLGQ